MTTVSVWRFLRRRRELRQLLRDVAAGEIGPGISKRAQELINGKPPPGIEKRLEQLGTAYAFAKAQHARRKQERREALRRMHQEAFAWNREHSADELAPHGRCDCGCGLAFRHAEDGACDHWVPRSQGGPHVRENGWRLTHVCHRMKGEDHPSRAAWNERRQRYCDWAGIPFVPRRER